MSFASSCQLCSLLPSCLNGPYHSFRHFSFSLCLLALLYVHFLSLFFSLLFNPSIHVVLSSPTPEVSWMRRDGELSETRTTKDMFDRRLRFTNISESDGGEYQCIAENSQGNTKHIYMLTVEGIALAFLYYTLIPSHTHTHIYISWEIVKKHTACYYFPLHISRLIF